MSIIGSGEVQGEMTQDAAAQCLKLWRATSTMQHDIQAEDSFSWPCSKLGSYTAKDAYKRLRLGREEFKANAWIWKSKAPF